MVRGGKTDKNGRVSYMGCIRHLNPLLCAHNAVAPYLCMRFTISKEPFPSVTDAAAFFAAPMWPGNQPGLNVTYAQMYKQLR